MVTDGVNSMGIRRKDIEGRGIFSNKITKNFVHPLDLEIYFKLFYECQGNILKIVDDSITRGTGIPPFHVNADKWLNYKTFLRFRYNPLQDGWADKVDNGFKAPDYDYNGLHESQCFCTDRFWLCMDSTVVRDHTPDLPPLQPSLSLISPPKNLSNTCIPDLSIPLSVSPDIVSESFFSYEITNKRCRLDQLDEVDDNQIGGKCVPIPEDNRQRVITPDKYPFEAAIEKLRPSLSQQSSLVVDEEDPDIWSMLSGILAKDDSSCFN
jgi:hypothetical protein